MLCLVLGAVTLAPAHTDSLTRNFADLSIEELMDESVTSVSKKAQRFGDAAAAISVLSNEDLHRSGATTLMEALRLVPGVNVARVNSSEWAISARGFNSVFSNKLLVLIDGRVVYNPLFAGVFWDLQQVMLDDVDRIEVIRGPGAAVWGANAVNGVINVVSRSARDTPGGLIYGGGGDGQERMGGVRYGGQSGPSTFYRVFASYRRGGDFPLASGMPGGDAWEMRQGGFRVDSYPAGDTQLTWQADATSLKLDAGASTAANFNTLGRWTRRLPGVSTVEVQAYYDRVSRHEPARADTRWETIDLSTQHTFAAGARQSLIWGTGYRNIDGHVAPTSPIVQVRLAHFRQQLFSAFLQDEFQLIPDTFTLSLGAKLEHNDYTGWEFQPSLRAMLKPTPASTVWAAVSRAVRTPSAVEGEDVIGFTAGTPIPGPDGGLYLPTVVGNRQLGAELLQAYEAGYRVQASPRVSADVALFHNNYSRLIGMAGAVRFVPGTPFGQAEMPFTNLLRAETYGGEAALTVSPTDRWRVTASYSRLAVRYHGGPTAEAEGATGSPESQILLRSAHDLTRRISVDVQLRQVSALLAVAAYTTADFRLAYRWSDRIELSLVGRDLFSPQHAEQGVTDATLTTEQARRIHAGIAWRF